MAAAPAEVLPPGKRRKQDTGCLETSLVFPATESAGWSWLPDDLVRRIADTFIATNDLDHYMCFRAVCPNWRRATDDPKKDTYDHRFHPRLWIVLDEVFQSDDDRRIMLNTATGRFLRKKLPLLMDYYVVATASGFIILADRSPPHAAHVFNPLTGHMVSFVAPVPPEVRVAFICSSRKTSSIALLLLGDSSRKLYTAVPDSESFVSRDVHQIVYNFIRKQAVGGANPHIAEVSSGFFRAFTELRDLLKYLHGDFAKIFSTDLLGDVNDIRCFPVGLATHMPLVLKTHTTLLVFKMNANIGKLQHMQSLNNFSIFIGHRRCVPVDAYEFPGIEANCVYYTQHLGSSAHICKYNIKDVKVERISEAPEFVKQDTQFVLVADRPFTIIQLLCSYTINSPDSQLALQHKS
ncbi:unnamed protein product [Alopecurus aequalis]